MANEVYRVVREDGGLVGEGRGSDPFTNRAAARRRATKLTNESKRYWKHGMRYVVEVSEVSWRRLDD